MKILITGCAGFIGAHFTFYILESYPNDTVVGVDSLTYAASDEALSELMKYDRFRFYRENICNASAIDRIFATEEPDVVVNFAAETHVDRSIADARPFIETNVIGTQTLLDASVRYGVRRFHQISTDEVYGDLPIDSTSRFDEASPLNPSSPYSASKAAADLLVLSYMRTHRLPTSISRSTNNYGAYQHSEKLIPCAVNRLLSRQPIQIYGDGRNIRDWLFVGDHCRAIDLIIREGKCEIYNISADNEMSNIDLVKRIMSLSGYPNGELVFVKDRQGHDRRYPICSKKIKALGWTPLADFETQLEKTVNWLIMNQEKPS